MKKLFLLFVSMMLTMVARADESGTCGLNLAWTFEDSLGTLTISGSGVMRDFALQRSPWYHLHEGILKVVIETGAASICDFAFEDCTGLTSFTIPNSVTSLGGNAFEGCSGLTSITIPESVTIIESSTFDGCSSLASITIPKSVTSIRYRAFYNCTHVKKPLVTKFRFPN